MELKEQLWYLAYVSFQHLKGEFEANASAIDAETSTSCQEPVTAPEVKSEEDLTNASSQEDVRATTLLVTEDSFTDDYKTSVMTTEVTLDLVICKETDSFIKKALMAIKKVASNLRYKPKHLRRKKFKVFPYEFASVLRKCSSMCIFYEYNY